MSAGSVNYRRGINASITGFWGGALDYNQFTDTMLSVIHRGIPAAWYEGAAECGILPADLSPEEKTALRQAIFHETNYIGRLATDIEAGSKANGGLLRPLKARGKTWVNRYLDIVNDAKMRACADQKLKWVRIRPTKDPCASCAKLENKVKRASYWQRVGVHPQGPPNPFLDCGGWLCGHGFVVTDEPLSRGPLPRLP